MSRKRKSLGTEDEADRENPITPSDLFAAIVIVHTLGVNSTIDWQAYDEAHNPPPLVDVYVRQAYRRVRL